MKKLLAIFAVAAFMFAACGNQPKEEEVAADADPVQMVLRYNIAGFREGLKLIGEGGKIKLVIPAELAYGPQGNRGIEPTANLIFEVGLDKIGKVAAKEE